MKRILSLLIFVFLVSLTIQSVNAQSGCTDTNCNVGSTLFGTNIGSYQGIISYSNGNTSCVCNLTNPTGGINGIKWQCVEYARRFLYNVYGKLLPTVSYAKNFVTASLPSGMTRYVSNSSYYFPSSVTLQVGDAIVTDFGTPGHIAIVRQVTPDIRVIQQNFANSTSDANYLCNKTTSADGSYMLQLNGSSHKVKAIIRAAAVTPAVTPTLINPANNATGLTAPITLTYSCSNCTEYRVQIVESTYFTGFSASTGLNGSSCTNCAYNGNIGNATSFLWTGAQPGKTYYWTVRGSNSGGTSSFATYRTFTTASSTGTCTTPTTSQFSLGSPTTNSVFVSVSYSGANSYGYQYRQVGATNWIDWSATGSSTTISGLASGTNYEVKVRVRCSSNNVWSSFSSSKSFSTTSTTGTCTTPTTSQFSIGSTTSSSAVVTITLTSGINNYDYQYRTLSGTWIDLPATTVNTTTISGLTSGLTYEVRVAVRCSSTNTWSNWSSAKSFTTSSSGGTAPANDNPCGATTIFAGSSCSNTSATNVGATTTTIPAAPTSCTLGSGKDIWIKVQVPSSGVVTIRLTAGTLTDAVMAVYNGSSCSSLSGISCEDDNSNGNGSLMPVITITGYPAGTWLYARIWGYGGASGTFSICAMNYSTVNKTEEYGQLTDNQLTGKSISLYPNPAVNFVTMNYLAEADENLTIKIYNSSGSEVVQQTVTAQAGNNKLPINIENLPNGSYLVNVQSPFGSTTKKLLIVK